MRMSLLYGCRFLGGALLLSVFSFDASAFVCSLNGGSEVDSGVIDIYIQPNQDVGPYGNIVFDASDQLLCRNNTQVNGDVDLVAVMPGTRLGDKLSSLENPYTQARLVGDLLGPGWYIPLPIADDGGYTLQQWYWYAPTKHMMLKAVLLNPIGGAAEAINLKAGDLIATYRLVRYYKPNVEVVGIDPKWFTVNIRTSRDFGVPVGSCDVNSRNINVIMGDYPSDTSYKDVNLSVKCWRRRGIPVISYSISGRMQTETIFSNVAPSFPATGIGIELVRNDQPVRADEKIFLQLLDNGKSVPLNLKARYALLEGEKLSDGNVQAVIAVNFTYN